MEILQIFLGVVGILAAVGFIGINFIAPMLIVDKIFRNKILLVLASICASCVIAHGILYEWNVFFIIAIICWVPSIGIIISEIKNGKV